MGDCGWLLPGSVAIDMSLGSMVFASQYVSRSSCRGSAIDYVDETLSMCRRGRRLEISDALDIALSINHSMNQSTNSSINRSINQSVYVRPNSAK